MPNAPTWRSFGANGWQGGVNGIYGNSGTGDHNELWRSTPTEYGGAWIKIGDDLAWCPDTETFYSFVDYNVASGVSYSYQLVAVDAGGGTASSTIQQATPVLGRSASVHAVIQMESSGTAENSNWNVWPEDMIPHNRLYTLGASQLRHSGMFGDIPIIEVSAIEQNSVGLLIRIPVLNTPTAEPVVRENLRQIVLSRRYACLRDTRGNKFFGLMNYSEVYSIPTFTDITMTFDVLDFSEALP